MTQQLQTIIDNAWENRASLPPSRRRRGVRDAVEHVIAELNTARCAWPAQGRRPVDGAPVDQEGRAAVVPPEGQRDRCRPAT